MSRSGWLQADEQAEQPQDGAVPDSPKANEQQVGKHFFKAFSLLNSVKHMYIYSGHERSGWLQADGQAERPQDGAVPDSPKANEQQVGKRFFKAFSLLNSVKHMYIYSGREPQWMVAG